MDVISTRAGSGGSQETAAALREDRERALVARVFADRLREDDLVGLLEYLNGLTDHRFTGV